MGYKSFYNRVIKRIIDIIISILLIVILSPLFIIVCLVVFIFDQKKVFFIQKRTGKDGDYFYIYKFRTMKDNKVTKIGKFLRKTSLDELPQMMNILKGDMSFIGPRPWILTYYKNFNKEQKRRTLVRPGLIGLAQVNGRNDIDIFTKIKYDLEYVDNVNLLLDIKILIKAFSVIVDRGGNKGHNHLIEKEINMLKKGNGKK